MAKTPKPILHGRDHAPDGPDPIPGLGGGIQFDTDPQTGVYLWINTTGTDPGTGRGINLMSDTPIQLDGSAVQLYAETDDVEINSVAHDVIVTATHDVRQTGGRDVTWAADRDVGVNADRDIAFTAVGNVLLHPNNTAAGGLLIILGLPTSDPGVTGALWNSSGTLKIS